MIPGIQALDRIPDLENIYRILIVDDEPHFRSACRALTAGEGRVFDECATGREAILKLDHGDFDLVVLDLGLPDISGIEIMEWLRNNSLQTSVIVFSANDSIDCAIHALRWGAFEFIRKHGDPERLIEAVDRALRRRRLEKEHAIMTARLEHSERLHRFLVEQSPDFIYTLDGDGRFVFVNGRVEVLLGYSPEELIGQHYSVIVHEDDLEKARYAFNERRIGDRATTNFEVRLRGKMANVVHFDNRMIVAILSSQGIYAAERQVQDRQFIGSSGVARDITERKKAEETIAYQAFHDLLTGLPNRTLYVDRLALALAQGKRRQQKVGVMFIDMDRFKLVNDTYGHAVGDQLLKDFALRIRNCLRSGDTLARQGGDEFTALLPDVRSGEDVTTIAAKIIEELKRPFTLAERNYHTTVSIGIALFPEDGETPEALIRSADIAMYQAKAQGKNGYLSFSPAFDTVHVHRISLENDLRHALQDGKQFELHFQPQISNALGCVVGLEALVRWNHPTQGVLGPDAFVSLAEECDLVVPLSDWVLREACWQLARLRNNGHVNLKLGVNLSPKEFEREDLLDRVMLPLLEHGVPPGCIEIEITEGLLMHDVEAVIAKVRALRRAGVRVSIDDFGIRYSSLNYLRRFAVNGLKIDQSFVRDISVSRNASAIIQAIMGVANGFGLEVTAEGVENQIERDTLLTLGCDRMQGYYFAKPLAGSELDDFLGRDLRLRV